MASNEYHFITTWRIVADAREIAHILANGPDLARWWPAVYLEVHELEPGDASGVGKVIDLYTKGWLPYTLRWQFRVTDVQFERSVTLETWGDFVGRGIWTFEQQGPEAVITYDWKVRAEKPILRWLSALLKPIFSANHQWAMAMGERSLRLELARRHAATPEDLARIPPPPPPSSTAPLALLAAVVAVGIALGVSGVTRRRIARRHDA
jgi:hypothetical protein